MNKHTKLGMQNKFGLKEIYTIFIIISPILFIYGTGIGSVTVSDLILILLNILMIFNCIAKGKINLVSSFIPFVIYILIISVIQNVDNEVWFRTLRYLFYLCNIIFFAKEYFNFNFGIKTYRLVSLISTTYIFIQFIAYKVIGVYIPGVLLNANIVSSDLYDYNSVFQQAMFKRFMAFFQEPSHYAIFIVGYATIILFTKLKGNSFSKKYIIEFCFLVGGIAISTSILGVLMIGTMLGIWMLTTLFKGKKNTSKLFLFVFILMISIILISKTTAFEYFTNSSIVSRQAEGRFGGYSLLNELNDSVLSTIFGNGMVNLEYGYYLASYPLIIYYFGYVGLGLFVIAIIPYLFKNKLLSVSWALLICLLGISLGSEILLGRFILIFLPFIVAGRIIRTESNQF